MSPFTILKRLWVSLAMSAVTLATASQTATAASTAPYWPAYTQASSGILIRDHAGNAYMTFMNQGYVQQIKPDGTAGMQWTGLNGPGGLAEAKDGSGIVTSTASGLRKLGFDGTITSINSQTDLGYIGYAPDGTLYSTVYGAGKVYQINDAGQVSEFVPTGTVSQPASFSFDDNGDLVIPSYGSGRVLLIKKDKSVQTLLTISGPIMVRRYYGQGWLVGTTDGIYLYDEQWHLQSKLVNDRADHLITLDDGTILFVAYNTAGIKQLIGAPAGSTLPSVNQPPSATLISPVSGQQFTSPANLTLSATATDTDGTITQVAFFNGTTLLGTVTQAPYTITIPNLAAGSYSIKAIATDNLGATGSSNLASIVVDSLPTVNLVASPNTATAPATLALTANASDTDGSIAKVEFFNGATSLGVVTQAPFSFKWTNVAAGTYTLTVKATDNLGGTTTSSAVTVVVNTNSGTGTSGPEQVYYIQADHLNTPRILTDKDNGIVWQWGQDEPFGATVANPDPANSGKPTEFNLRFPGQYFDKETNTHYNYFRDYDPAIGRYIQSDPMGLKAGPNTYAYVEDNPISKVDPKGLEACPGGEWTEEAGDFGLSAQFGGYVSLSNVNVRCKSKPDLKCKAKQFCVGGGPGGGVGAGGTIGGGVNGASDSGDLSGWSNWQWYVAGGPWSAQGNGDGGSSSISKSWGFGAAAIRCVTYQVKCTKDCEADSK